MKPGKVRPIAICVIEHGGKILVQNGYNQVKQQHFARPLGGSIEFGEYGHETIIRELQEEVGLDVTDVQYLTTLENIFTFQDKIGHEIVLVYQGCLVDDAYYSCPTITGKEDDGTPITASWVSLVDFDNDVFPLYPTGLLEYFIASCNDNSHSL